jgi:hypothetical protein
MTVSESFVREQTQLMRPLRAVSVASVLCLLAACGSDPVLSMGAGGSAAPSVGATTDPSTMNPAGAAGSTPSGAAGTSSSSAAGTAAASGRGAAGSTSAPSTGGSSGSSMAAAAGTSAPAAGSGGAVPAAPSGASDPMLADCMSGSREACRTFTTSEGTKIQLGPYGAIMDVNVGAGFETAIAAGDSDGGATCSGFAGLFGEDPTQTQTLLDTMDLKFDLYTVYRPAKWVEGEKYPILTWGNGTCAQPEGYGPLLRYFASHGFFVVAANSRWVGGNSAMTKALDFAFAANDDPKSPYYQKLDTSKVGAMGHSQGGGATVTAASDSRIKSIIIYNGGNSSSKPFLAISADYDIGNPTVQSFKTAVNSATKGAFVFFHNPKGMGTLRGHLTLMIEPERLIEPSVAWFKYTLSDDADSGKWFVGSDCKLCASTMDYDFGQKGL